MCANAQHTVSTGSANVLLNSFPCCTRPFPKHWSLALHSSGSSHLCLPKSVLRWLWIPAGRFRVGSALFSLLRAGLWASFWALILPSPSRLPLPCTGNNLVIEVTALLPTEKWAQGTQQGWISRQLMPGRWVMGSYGRHC